MESEFSVEDQLHAEVERLADELFKTKRQLNGLHKKSKAQKRTISKLSQMLRDKDRKIDYLNKPVSTRRKGKRK